LGQDLVITNRITITLTALTAPEKKAPLGMGDLREAERLENAKDTTYEFDKQLKDLTEAAKLEQWMYDLIGTDS